MTRVNHDLRSVNSGTIYLVPQPNFINLAIPDLSLPDTAQKYDIGTKFEFNNKVYFYAYASGAVIARQGCKVANAHAIPERGIAASADLYATSIVLETASPDGPALNGLFTEDYLKGGAVAVFASGYVELSSTDFTRGIISSTAVTTVGDITLGLDAPIPSALLYETAYATAAQSPYVGVTYSGEVQYSVAGVPACSASAERWVWLQTWGMCWVVGAASHGLAGAMGVSFRQDGSLDVHEQSISDNMSSQHAGYVMFEDVDGAQAVPFTYLQIAR